VRDAVDACGATDERSLSGRRSRVVPISRRWYQAGDDADVSWPATVAKKPGSPRRSRRKP